MSRWWWRPLRSFLTGVLLGLIGIWVVLQLPDRLQPWGIIGMVVVVMVFVVWQHQSLRRDMKAFEQRMAELEREL